MHIAPAGVTLGCCGCARRDTFPPLSTLPQARPAGSMRSGPWAQMPRAVRCCGVPTVTSTCPSFPRHGGRCHRAAGRR
eukprot:5047994-Prymnesium_polylepis.1